MRSFCKTICAVVSLFVTPLAALISLSIGQVIIGMAILLLGATAAIILISER